MAVHPSTAIPPVQAARRRGARPMPFSTPMRGIAYREGRDYIVYSDTSGSIAAGTTQTGVINTSFNHNGRIVAIGCTATMGTAQTSPLITPGIGNRDSFKISFARQNNNTLVTNQIAASALFGMLDSMWVLPVPWPVYATNVITASITNQQTLTAITVWVAYHVEVEC